MNRQTAPLVMESSEVHSTARDEGQACCDRNVEARVENFKLSKGNGLKRVPGHSAVVQGWGRSLLGREVASKHMSDIVVKVCWRRRCESGISKVVVLKGIQIGCVLEAPFQMSETCAPDFRGDAPLEGKSSNHALLFC